MKRTMLLSALAVSAALAGCVLETEYPVQDLPVTGIAAVSVNARTVTFTVSCTTPEADCWQYFQTIHSPNGELHDVRISGRRRSNDPCAQVTGSLSVTTSLTVDEAGQHRFRFWRPGTTIDTTITIR